MIPANAVDITKRTPDIEGYYFVYIDGIRRTKHWLNEPVSFDEKLTPHHLLDWRQVTHWIDPEL